MNEQDLRQALVAYGIRLVKSDLVQGTWGNLSVRLDEAHMLVTPSGLDYETLTAEDIVRVDLNTLAWEGGRTPTSEKSLHQAIYRNRPEVNAIIHTHSDCCSVLAAARAPLPAATPAGEHPFTCETRVAKYGLPGTRTLAKNTVAALGTHPAALMAHHGAVCCGDSLESAFACCAALEDAARQYIEERQPAAHG